MLPDNFDFGSLTTEEVRAMFARAEAFIKSHDQIEIPLTHIWGGGVYAREIFIPKGSFILGAIHKFENLNVLSSGELSVITAEGVRRVKAPFTVVSPPGVQRLAYAHEDSTWTTFHATEERDVKKIEAKYVVKSYAELEKKETECLT